MRDVNLVYILHKLRCFLLTNVLVQRPSEIIRNIVLSVGKCSCAAKSAHDRARLTVNTSLHLVAVDRALTPVQRMSRLKDSYFKLRPLFRKLICRKDPSRPRADNNYIISHRIILHCI